MEAWVLIFIFDMGTPAVQVTFQSRQLCDSALIQLRERFAIKSSFRKVDGACVKTNESQK